MRTMNRLLTRIIHETPRATGLRVA
jgi:hypothetical protein